MTIKDENSPQIVVIRTPESNLSNRERTIKGKGKISAQNVKTASGKVSRSDHTKITAAAIHSV